MLCWRAYVELSFDRNRLAIIANPDLYVIFLDPWELRLNNVLAVRFMQVDCRSGQACAVPCKRVVCGDAAPAIEERLRVMEEWVFENAKQGTKLRVQLSTYGPMTKTSQLTSLKKLRLKDMLRSMISGKWALRRRGSCGLLL